MDDSHQAEAKAKWGQTEAFKIAAERTKKYTAEDWERIKREAKGLYQAFQHCKSESLNSQKVECCVNDWQRHLHETYYPCDDEMLLNLADLYEQDLRYANNIDKAGGEGTASRMIEAIRYWKRRS